MTTPPEPEPVEIYGLNTIGDHCVHPVIVKWFRIGPEGGIEFHGYDADEVLEILRTMSTLNADAVRYRPE